MIPVADVDRAKAFYAEQAGFTVDVDFSAGESFRVVQLTPPGSACSIALMHNPDKAGNAQGLHLIVNDIEAARAELIGRGAAPGEPFHFEDGRQVPGADPNHGNYESFM